MPDSKIDPLDVGALERAVNDSATRVSGIWLSFVAFSAYVAAVAANVSHRQLFLEEPIKLPTINVDLPLVGSSILLPLLFVIFHVYVLLQVVLLARTARAYNDALDQSVPDPADNARVRQRLANTIFAQLFAGSPRERGGIVGGLLIFMAWVTLAIIPIFVLILFQLKFLPYHHHGVTWTHRLLLVSDFVSVFILWASAVDARRDIGWKHAFQNWKAKAGVGLIAIASLVLMTFPSEPQRRALQYLFFGDGAACRIPGIAVTGYFENLDRLSLSEESLVDPEKADKIQAAAVKDGRPLHTTQRTRILRQRDLACSSFAKADLRFVDFTDAMMAKTNLEGADLRGATFLHAELDRADLNGARLNGAKLEDARMQHAELEHADMRGAVLDFAQLDGANMRYANLQGTSLRQARLAGADLSWTKAQGADFEYAQIPNADMRLANMQGASFSHAFLAGAFLYETELQGALLDKASLPSAMLDRAYLQGASLSAADLRGAILHGTQLQGSNLEQAGFQGAFISKVFLWRARGWVCANARVVEPNFDPQAGRWPLGNRNEPPEVAPLEIEKFVERAVSEIPESSENGNRSRDAVRKRMQQQLSEPKPDDEKAWRDCAAMAKITSEENYAADLMNVLVNLACNYSSPAFAKAVYRNWILREDQLHDDPVKLSTADLKKSLRGLNGTACPGAEKLKDEMGWSR